MKRVETFQLTYGKGKLNRKKRQASQHTRPFSSSPVNITMVAVPCSQTILQKSVIACGTGPAVKKFANVTWTQMGIFRILHTRLFFSCIHQRQWFQQVGESNRGSLNWLHYARGSSPLLTWFWIINLPTFRLDALVFEKTRTSGWNVGKFIYQKQVGKGELPLASRRIHDRKRHLRSWK